MIRVGSLFSGYGGLEMGVIAALARLGLRAKPVWHCEFDDAPARVLAHHWPGVPNLGDITKTDFTRVPGVDVLTGGFPCQDLSLSGRRAGMRPGTRSGLWADFVRAIDTLRPRLVVIENARGILSGCAESSLEPCPGCVGDGEHRPPLRALGRVLGDLADLGFDAEWCGIRASDVGAPHLRFRVFVIAWPADAGCVDGQSGRPAIAGEAACGRSLDRAGGCGAHSPDAASIAGRVIDGDGRGIAHHADRDAAGRDSGAASRAEAAGGDQPDRDRSGVAADDAGSDFGRPVELLPTPKAGDGEFGLPRTSGRPPERATHLATRLAYTDFGIYQAVVDRWERVTRPAPEPLERGSKGALRLAPAFPEWMMGLPHGWVTDPVIWEDVKPSTARIAELKMIGNGVCPQQAEAAVLGLAERARLAPFEAVAA